MPREQLKNLSCSVLFTVCLLPSIATAEDTIKIHVNRVLRTVDENPIGINVNFVKDNDAIRPEGSRPLVDALQALGAKWVRYPGGEKSDWHFFAAPPYAAPAPRAIGYYARHMDKPLDFDQYVAVVRKLGGTCYVVTSYDNVKRTGVREGEYLEHAVAWVRYANVTREYGVRYWEVGNENWHNQTATADEMGRVVATFSRAMKQVDAKIKIGCSGNSVDWFKRVLEVAGDDIDFLSVSNYFSASSYGTYSTRPDRNLLSSSTRSALTALAGSEHKDHIELLVAEFGAVDFGRPRKWQANDLGHAIVNFDMAGQILCNPRIKSAMFWTTRWMDDMNPVRRSYALGTYNQIMPVGRPLAIWGRFLKRNIVATTSPGDIPSFACYDPASKGLTVFLVNKCNEPKDVKLALPAESIYAARHRYEFSGSSPADMNPQWRDLGSTQDIDRGVTLRATSITVLDYSSD